MDRIVPDHGKETKQTGSVALPRLWITV